MRVSEQIKEIAKHQNMTITELANAMGTSQANLANKLVRDNFKLSDIQDIGAALNYNVLEIVMRGNNETVIIREDTPIAVVPNTRYLIYDECTTLQEEFEKYGVNDVTFKDVVFELLDDELQKVFKDLWNITIPKRLENEMRDMAKNVLTPMIDVASSRSKED